jgi:hypothetical protein
LRFRRLEPLEHVLAPACSCASPSCGLASLAAESPAPLLPCYRLVHGSPTRADVPLGVGSGRPVGTYQIAQRCQRCRRGRLALRARLHVLRPGLRVLHLGCSFTSPFCSLASLAVGSSPQRLLPNLLASHTNCESRSP